MIPLDFTTIVLFFPLLLPVWEQRPIVRDDIYPCPYAVQVPDSLIAKQEQGLQVVDAEMRGRMLVYLHETRHPQAIEPLLAQLAREPSADVLATILDQLCCFTPDAALIPVVTPYLRHGHTAVRAAAVRAWAHQPVPDLAPVQALAVDDAEPRVRAAAWQALRAAPARVAPAFLLAQAKHAEPAVRAAVCAALLAQPGADARDAFFRDACADPSPLVRIALAAGLTTAPEPLAADLARRLAGDAFATVRVHVAAALPRLPSAQPLLPVLLGLADDPDPEVRRVALAALAATGAPEAAAKAVAHFGDAGHQVHKQAEDTAVALHARTDVRPVVAARFEDPDPTVRYHVFRTLGRLEAKEFVPRLTARLSVETLPANLAALLFALGQVGAADQADAVAAFGRHDSPEVRAQVGFALGRMAVPRTYPVLEQLAFDKTPAVRQEALLGVGRIADGAFNPLLLKVLNSVSMTSGISGADRGIAAWAAGRTRPISPEVMKRLVVQCTTPVIPTDFGPVFEDETVLISCDFALAQCTRDAPEFRKLADFCIQFHSKEPNPNAPISMGTLVPTAELKEYARQAHLYLEGQPVEPARRPTQEIYLPYRPARKPQP